MSIQLVTYANQTVTPTNDAIIYERAIDQNGIFYGCNVTVSGNEVHITGGYGMVCGREFTIQSEAITVTLAPSGTLDGRLYVRLDLADADNPIQLLTATGNTLPPLEQDDDVNYTNGTYEMELATFTVGVSALSDCTETFETIYGSKQIVYSTNEMPIGTWIDGKTIYRKVYTGTLPNNSNYTTVASLVGVEEIIAAYGICDNIPWGSDRPTSGSSTSANIDGKWGNWLLASAEAQTVAFVVGENHYNKSYKIIIEYTKS